MVTVVGVSVIMNTAGFVVENMTTNNKHQSKGKKPVLIVVPDLFGNEKTYSGSKNKNGHKTMMMPAVAMPKGVRSYNKGKRDHEIFEADIIHDVHAQNRQRSQ